MHFYTMTITSEIESEYRSELKLWENSGGDIWIQIGYDDNDDPYSTQGMAITTDDAKALIAELTRLIKQTETAAPAALGQQLPLLQKVNWNK